MIKADKHSTPVIFRKFRDNGEIIAIFPTLPGTNCPNTCMSYMHVGQHGSMDVSIASIAILVKPSEYIHLKRELQGLGYKLRVITSMCSHHRNERLALINKVRAVDNA